MILMKKDMLWEGTIKLDNWDNYYETDLKLVLNIGGDCIVDEITDIHENGYRYLLDNQVDILRIVIDEIYSHYARWQEEYGYDEEEKRLIMPNMNDKQGLREILKPIRIFILDIESGGLPYIGIEFQCSWDEEHGLGVMFHENRVVEIGGADTAFLSWIAEEDKRE
jgi:hypothetical protein